MTDASPSRKKPRLLAKGQEKIGSLFQRRRRARRDHTNNDDDYDSNLEDDEPILSRIVTIPFNQFSKLVTDQEETAVANDGGISPRTTHRGRDYNDGLSREDTRVDDGGSKNIKAQRRLGMGPANSELLHFQSQDILSQGKRIAVSRHPQDNFRDFIFDQRYASGLASGQSRPDAIRRENRDSQTRTNPLKEVLLTQTQTRNIPNPSTQAQRNARSSPSGPLDHLKLKPKQPTPPRLDQASDITNIDDFIRPRVPIPEAQTEVYRNKDFRPELSAETFNSTVPDWPEIFHFVKDCEGGNASELTVHGDVPVLSKPEAVRVPVGARRSRIASGVTNGNGNDTTMTGVLPVGLPPHVQRRRRKFKLRTEHDGVTPDNAYTSTDRVLDAYITVRQARKRKRATDPAVLPPPDFVYKRTDGKDFNIFRDGITRLPELCLMLAVHLPVQTLINLYSISKDFHIIVNQRLTTVILNQASLKAPNAARCYPWRCFKNFSQPDRALYAQISSLAYHLADPGQSHGNTDGVQVNVKPPPHPPSNCRLAKNPYLQPYTRRVPTFRWLQLAIHREKIIHALYHAFAARGVPLPGDPIQSEPGSFCNSLHKLWFIFDIPDNNRRIQFARTASLISNDDLMNIMMFVVKLDMICNSPIGADKRDGIRKILMSSCDGFDTILKVIRREEMRTELDMLRAWTRYGFQLDREDGRELLQGGGWVPLGLSYEDHLASKTVFGIPKEQVGMLKREFWGGLEYDRDKKQVKRLPAGVRRGIPGNRALQYLIRPDQLILREIVKRGYTFEKDFLNAVLEGYVDPRTFEAIPPRELNAGRSQVLEDEGEYSVDDAVAGLRALSVEEGGDDLLDLGDTSQGSSLTLMPQGPKTAELQHREEEHDFLESCMDAWRQEVEETRIERASMAYRVLE